MTTASPSPQRIKAHMTEEWVCVNVMPFGQREDQKLTFMSAAQPQQSLWYKKTVSMKIIKPQSQCALDPPVPLTPTLISYHSDMLHICNQQLLMFQFLPIFLSHVQPSPSAF